MQWKNTTTYSQGEKDRTPRTYEARAGVIRIVVTRHIHFDASAWVLSAHPFFDLHELASSEVEDAKREAMKLVRGALSNAMNQLDEDS